MPTPLTRQSPSGPINQPTTLKGVVGTTPAGSIAATTVSLSSMSTPGVEAGDSIVVDVPAALPGGILIGAARVIGADSAVVQVANITGAPIDPGILNFVCTVFRTE